MLRLLALLALAAPALAAPFSFGAWGDLPYFASEEPRVERLIADMNRESLAFAVHVGDFKASWSPCSDELFAERKALFSAHRHPFAFLPGDNEWTDCHILTAGRFDPRERLQKLRSMFYPAFRGAAFKVVQSDGMPENMLWRIQDVQFASLHITGSNDNFNRNAEMDAEHAERRAANLEWLERAFREAASAKAIVLLFHANLLFDRTRPPQRVSRRDAYHELRVRLAAHVRAYARPVLAVHGDTHTYRFDQPLHDPATGVLVGNFHRLEVPGSPAVNWIKVTIDPAARTGTEMFRVQPGLASPFTE